MPRVRSLKPTQLGAENGLLWVAPDLGTRTLDEYVGFKGPGQVRIWILRNPGRWSAPESTDRSGLVRRVWAAVDMGQAKGTACQGRGSLSEGPACHPSSGDGVKKIPCYTALRLAWTTGNPVLKREQSKEKQTFRLSKNPSQEEGQHQPINRRESSSTGKLRHRTSPPSSSSLKQLPPPHSPTQAQGFQEELGGRLSGA